MDVIFFLDYVNGFAKLIVWVRVFWCGHLERSTRRGFVVCYVARIVKFCLCSSLLCGAYVKVKGATKELLYS